jgi:hypothetical protein
MVVLKKVKSATLVEALVATVLVVVVFMIASLVLNNLLLNTFSKNTHQVEFRFNEVEYEIRKNSIKLPYFEEYKGWDITIRRKENRSKQVLYIIATLQKNGKEISRKRIYGEK